VRSAAAPIAIAELPDALMSEIEKQNSSWSELAVSDRLESPDQTWEVVLVGVPHYAPLAWQPVADVLQHVPADVVAIDQPPSSQPGLQAEGSSSDAPAWLEACLACSESMDEDMLYAATQADSDARMQLSARLAGLGALQLPAAVGKDILDPYEVFGLHSAAGYVTATSQIRDIARMLGYVPGAEYVAAMGWAQQHGAQLACLDAPLKLQEKWVARLVEDFDVSYAFLASQLDKEAQQLEALLLDDYRRWDWQLANAIQQQEPGSAVAAFKASKACAAATCSPSSMQQEVLRGMGRLQPLKWRHFAKKEAFMASRLAELCRAPLRAGQKRGTIVAVVGRQHVHPLMALWRSAKFWAAETERIEVGQPEEGAPPATSPEQQQQHPDDVAAALQEAMTGLGERRGPVQPSGGP
jgi:hypothetical protein